MDTRLTIQATGLTDVGKERKGNEDTFHCGRIGDDRHWFALVVDGCGGYKGGAEASRITRDAMLEYLTACSADEMSRQLKNALIYANNKVHDCRNTDEKLRYMCCVTTAVLVDLDKCTLSMVHVGDSRLYASIKGRIIKLSHDHSPIGRYEEEGILAESEAMNHPSRNVIERAIGVSCLEDDTDYIEQAEFPVASGLYWLLCSDGLSDMITSAEMNVILSGEGSLPDKAACLVEAANKAGGKDNITVVVLHAEGGEDRQTHVTMDNYSAMMNPDRMPDYRNLLRNVTMKSNRTETDRHEDSRPDTAPANGHVVSADEPQVSEEPDTHGADESLTEGCDISAELGEVPENLVECSSETSDKPASEMEAVASSQIENPASAFHTESVTRQAASKYRYFKIIGIWLCITIGAVLAVVVYHAQKESDIRQREESIRQQLLMRNLYFNINHFRSDTVSIAN